jgi:hypothetical protein
MPALAEVADEIGVNETEPPITKPVTGRIETAEDLAAALVRMGMSAETAERLRATGFAELI